MSQVQKFFRDGAWWAQRPDGTWTRWNEITQAWDEARPAFAPDGPPPSAAPREAPAAAVADEGASGPDMIFTSYQDSPLEVDVLRVYGFLVVTAALVLAVIAVFFGSPTMVFSGPPSLEELLAEETKRPSPYLFIAMALGLFGIGLVYIKRRGDEEWWPVQMAVLGLVLAGVLAVMANLAGITSGYDVMRFVYYWTGFLAIGWVFMKVSASRSW